jgi:PadR family transcriptional regulator PadR
MTDGGKADPAQGWVRGALELAVIAVLTEGDRHGYALAQRLAEFGLGPVRGGALYPVLGRLEADGSVRSEWEPGVGGPGRKVYSLTDAGHTRLAGDRGRWHDFTAAMSRLLDETTGDGR